MPDLSEIIADPASERPTFFDEQAVLAVSDQDGFARGVEQSAGPTGRGRVPGRFAPVA